MTVVIPGMDLDCERLECQPTNGMSELTYVENHMAFFTEKETLTAKYDSKLRDNVTVLQNKSPVWNEDSQVKN